MSFKTVSTIIFLATTIASPAAPRPWTSADGLRKITGDFVRRDAAGVIIRDNGGRLVTIPFSKLHASDKAWVEANHPDAGAQGSNKPGADDIKAAPVVAGAVFDQLVFGDDRAKVLEKLKASKVVEMTMDETFLGRTGLNGVFRTRKKVGGLDAFLYFNWDDNGGLNEVTLQTDTLPRGDYDTRIEPSWKGFIDLITTLYGKPVQGGSLPRADGIGEGSFMPSHLWSMETGGSVLLGVARDGEKFQLVVRFTSKKIKPVEY